MMLVITISLTIESNSVKKYIIGRNPSAVQNIIRATNKDNKNNT